MDQQQWLCGIEIGIDALGQAFLGILQIPEI